MSRERPPEIEKGDGTVEHIVQDGARFHVVWWSTKGMHCAEPRCEINHGKWSSNR